MSIIAAAKCCLFCSQSWFRCNRANHQKDLFNYLAETVNKADMDCSEGNIEHEEHLEIIGLKSSLEKACLSCNGKAANVYFLVFEREFSKQTENEKSQVKKGVKLELKESDNVIHIKKQT